MSKRAGGHSAGSVPGWRGDETDPGHIFIDRMPEPRGALVGVGNVPRQVRPESEYPASAPASDALIARRAG